MNESKESNGHQTRNAKTNQKVGADVAPAYMAAPKPPDEEARLAALRHYEILDTDPEPAFDDLTLLASHICGTPMSLVSLIDEERQWFKSKVGIEGSESPRDTAFCAHAILGRDTFEVPDAAQDERFAGNPFVTEAPNIRFYAGAPLVTDEGRALGTLCVIDHEPRHLSDEQREALSALGRQVIAQLELRRKLRDLKQAIEARDRVEAEKAVQDAEIARDLRFAREFQQSMMPNTYPQVPDAPSVSNAPSASDALSAPLRLNFHHIYRPTLSLGGDFFDVIKLSEHRAGIFMADVMGHGARSALMTAILRALLREAAHATDDPAQLLAQMNQRFFDNVQGSRQFVFASAFYLILDTQTATASYACAGHPPPLLANRGERSTEYLSLMADGKTHCEDEHPAEGSALGLERESVYSGCSRPIAAGDVFMLFTDGVVEAPDADGDEFGEERLLQTVRDNFEQDAGGLSRSVESAVLDFTGATVLPDDLCIITVEVGAANAAAVIRNVEA